MTKEEWALELEQDAYDQRRQEEDELKLEYDLRDKYDFFCMHFEREFIDATDAINTLMKLHDKYNHTLDVEDLI